MNEASPLILVHGAWHGSWCWRYVTPLLQQQGYQVFAPDLPGHPYELSLFKEITLSTYVNFLIKLIEPLDQPVVLVGHSLAGVILSQVAELIPEKIKKIIYICALLPKSGSSCVLEASNQQLNNVGKLLSEKIDANEMRCNLSYPLKIKEAFYHCCSEEDFQIALSLLQPEPLSPMIEQVTLSEQKFGKVAKCYIECLQDKAVDLANQRRMLNNAHIRHILSLDCDHSPFFSAPAALVAAIVQSLTQDS